MLDRLPVELIQRVVHFLESDPSPRSLSKQYRTDLRALCLVSPTLCGVAQPVLFHRIALGPRRCPSLVHALSTTPRLSSAVHTISVSQNYDAYRALFPLLHNLAVVQIECCTVDWVAVVGTQGKPVCQSPHVPADLFISCAAPTVAIGRAGFFPNSIASLPSSSFIVRLALGSLFATTEVIGAILTSAMLPGLRILSLAEIKTPGEADCLPPLEAQLVAQLHFLQINTPSDPNTDISLLLPPATQPRRILISARLSSSRTNFSHIPSRVPYDLRVLAGNNNIYTELNTNRIVTSVDAIRLLLSDRPPRTLLLSPTLVQLSPSLLPTYHRAFSDLRNTATNTGVEIIEAVELEMEQDDHVEAISRAYERVGAHRGWW